MNNGSKLFRQVFMRSGGLSMIGQRSFSTNGQVSLRNSLLKGHPALSSTVPKIHSTSKYITGIVPTRYFASMSFEEAVQKSTSMKDPDNVTKLKMYALYKQATSGKASGKRPGAMDFIKRAKFDAWNELGDLSQDEAKKQYIDLVKSGLGDDAGSPPPASLSSSAASGSSGVEGLVLTVAGGVRTIRLNRPDKFNALTVEMYRGITEYVKEANDDPNTKVVVMTGTGNYYCSGNDLSAFVTTKDPVQLAKTGRDVLLEFVDSFIYCQKPLVAVINGPAVGISVTVLGLFDSLFVSDQATFTTPFTALGQCPEGCSSYTFPRIMGYAKASEFLYFNQKMTAAEAEKVGFVTKVIPHDRLKEETDKRINEIAQLPIKSLVYAKDLVRGRERDLLHQVNEIECDRLHERWLSEDCMNAIQKFMTRKSKI